MPFISVVTEVVDSAGVRLAPAGSNVILQLGDGVSGTATDNGSTYIVTITAPNAGVATTSVLGAVLMSVAPAVAGSPTAVGTNDPRVPEAPGAVGAVLYSDGTNWKRLAAGTAGYVLQANGAVAPSWGAIATSGAIASRPATSASGREYFATDQPTISLDPVGGSGWVDSVVACAVSTGNAASYTVPTGNGGKISVKDEGSLVRVTSFANTSNYALKAGGSIAGATWIARLSCYATFEQSVQYPGVGVTVTKGTVTATSASYFMGLFANNRVANQVGLQSWQGIVGNGGASRTNVTENDGVFFLSGILHVRILNDGTNIIYQYSYDGDWWNTYASLTLPSALTHWGIFVGNGYNGTGGTSGTATALILRNECTALTTPQLAITGATNATPIVCTVSSTAGLRSGDFVAVHAVGGNTGANVNAYVEVLSSTTFSLLGIAGTGAYTSGGNATLLSR